MCKYRVQVHYIYCCNWHCTNTRTKRKIISWLTCSMIKNQNVCCQKTVASTNWYCYNLQVLRFHTLSLLRKLNFWIISLRRHCLYHWFTAIQYHSKFQINTWQLLKSYCVYIHVLITFWERPASRHTSLLFPERHLVSVSMRKHHHRVRRMYEYCEQVLLTSKITSASISE